MCHIIVISFQITAYPFFQFLLGNDYCTLLKKGGCIVFSLNKYSDSQIDETENCGQADDKKKIFRIQIFPIPYCAKFLGKNI